MSQKIHIKQLFKNLEKQTPDTRLFENILVSIKKEQELKIIKKNIFIFSFCFIFSLSLTIFLLKILQIELTRTGFKEFFSLIFSDFNLIIKFWQTYLLSLLDSLPIHAFGIFLISIFVVNLFLNILLKNLKNFFIVKKIINRI